MIHHLMSSIPKPRLPLGLSFGDSDSEEEEKENRYQIPLSNEIVLKGHTKVSHTLSLFVTFFFFFFFFLVLKNGYKLVILLKKKSNGTSCTIFVTFLTIPEFTAFYCFFLGHSTSLYYLSYSQKEKTVG